MKLVLIVEDDEKIQRNLLLQLRDAGYGASATTTAEEALEQLLAPHALLPDLLLVDVRLPRQSGVELVKQLRAAAKLPPTIIISGEASITETVEGLRLGVHDFIEKPFTRERLLHSVSTALDYYELQQQLAALRAAQPQETIRGTSPRIAQLRDEISRVAATDSRVLIRGESGSGKELVAQAIHEGSSRRGKPFVKINCAAIPSHLIEGELFGHARGAFTDAKSAKRGLFEEADGGTLFLDEIGDMEYALQSTLLRVLEDGRVRRVGENVDRAVDVRVLAATHADLEEEIARKNFREDLYFRLSAVPLEVPPLRSRSEDVPLLFVHFLDLFCRRNQRPRLSVDRGVMERLVAYRWPGNVRELRNVAERLAVFGADPITEEQLPSTLLAGGATSQLGVTAAVSTIVPLRDFRAQCERDYIESVLQRTNWNFTKAAELLKIQRTYLHQKAVSLGIRKE
jgi:DNA-binding NtrC family response regulator